MERGVVVVVIRVWCHGPSVLLIGPIYLWQAYLRRRMGLKYDSDFLHHRQ